MTYYHCIFKDKNVQEIFFRINEPLH